MTQSYSKHNIKKVFLDLLPAQIFSNLTSSLSGIVNGIVIGKYLTSIDMIALGFATPITMLNSIVAMIISSGARIVCGEYIGRGEKKKIDETFSISIRCLLIFGVLMTIIGLTCAPLIVKLVGASENSIAPAASYIRGISIGVLPTIIAPCLMVFLQMENDSNYALVSTIVLAIVNYALGMLAMRFLNLGIFGVGLMTSISQYIVLFILWIRFRTKDNLPRFRHIHKFGITKEIIIVGLPTAFANLLYNLRNTVLNVQALKIFGEKAVQALSILGSSTGPYDAINIGVGSTILMLLSVYIGEKDREAIKQLARVSISIGLILGAAKVAVVLLFIDKLIPLYTSDLEVFQLTKDLYIQYSFSAPLNMITMVFSNSYQALKRITYTNIVMAFNAFVFPIGYVLATKGLIGINAIWTCYWTAEVAVLALMYIVACKHKHGIVHGVGDMLHLEDSIELETSKTISIKTIEDVVNVSRDIELFCVENNIDKKKAMIAGLCCEEMATNIIEHGFTKCKNPNSKVIDIYVGITGDTVNMRIKDNAVAFDPHIKLQNNDDPTSNIGIKMVSKLAKQMNYQNTFGLNVLAITL